MKNIKFNINIKLIIGIFLILSILLNYNYYTNIYKKMVIKIKVLKLELTKLNSEILEEKNKFKKNILIFKKIKKLENIVVEKKYEIEYLKNKVKSKKDIIHIIRTLVLQSNIKLQKIELKSEKIEKNNGILTFEFLGISQLKNFVYFLDMIEGKNNLLIVSSYTLTPVKNSKLWSINMTLKSVYLILKS